MFNEVDTNQMINRQQTQDRLNKFQHTAEHQRLVDQVTNKRAPKHNDGLLATAMTVVTTALLSGS